MIVSNIQIEVFKKKKKIKIAIHVYKQCDIKAYFMYINLFLIFFRSSKLSQLLPANADGHMLNNSTIQRFVSRLHNGYITEDPVHCSRSANHRHISCKFYVIKMCFFLLTGTLQHE